jgi:RHS repeat-associated protein
MWNGGTGIDNEYLYDLNGNIVADYNKGISYITYNDLNLPKKIQFTNGGTSTYRYDANGNKKSSTYITAIGQVNIPFGDPLSSCPSENQDYYNAITTTYIGNYIYENGQLKKVLTPEGYMSKVQINGTTTWQPNYFVKDHLGSTRALLTYYDNGTMYNTQTTNYYASGLEMEYSTSSDFSDSDGASKNTYLYNGKEMDRMHGLNMYDYGARGYDPALASWTTVDPLAEKYYSVSPYAFCLNNPVRFTDSDGREVDIEHGTGFLGLGKKETLKYDNGSLYNKDGSAYTGKVNGFLKKTVNALSSLGKTSEGASMVTELQSSSNVFTIKSAANNDFKANSSLKSGANLAEVQAVTGNTAGSNGSGGTIFWNSNSSSGGLDLSGGTERPTFIGLGHEMGHASDSNRGLLHYGGMDESGIVNPSSFTNVFIGATYNYEYNGLLKSEWRAVYRENLIRSQVGIPLRTNYGYDLTTGSPAPTGPRLLDSSNQPINYP